MFTIPGFECFNKFTLIEKGWSHDKKYLAESSDNKKLLIKVSSIADYDRKKAEFNAVMRISKLGIPMMMPIDFGTMETESLLYMVFSWIDGDDAEIMMPLLSEEDQYRLGCDSGLILKKIHSIKAPDEQQDWAERFNDKIDRNISNHKNCGIKVPKEERIIKFISDNRKFLNGRPQTIQHGDYHVGNIFITPEYRGEYHRFQPMGLRRPLGRI